MRRPVVLIAATGLLATLIASCDQRGTSLPTAPPVDSLAPAFLCARQAEEMVRLTRPGATVDDDLEALARLLPGGFGGYNPPFHRIFLVDTSRASDARHAVEVLMACGGTLHGLLPYVRNNTVVQGVYDYVQLRRFYVTLLRHAPPTWHMSDIDETRNRLYFEFRTEEGRQAFLSGVVGGRSGRGRAHRAWLQVAVRR